MADKFIKAVLWGSNDPGDDLIQVAVRFSRNCMWSDVQLKLLVVCSANCIYWTLHGMGVLRTIRNFLMPKRRGISWLSGCVFVVENVGGWKGPVLVRIRSWQLVSMKQYLTFCFMPVCYKKEADTIIIPWCIWCVMWPTAQSGLKIKNYAMWVQCVTYDART